MKIVVATRLVCEGIIGNFEKKLAQEIDSLQRAFIHAELEFHYSDTSDSMSCLIVAKQEREF